MRVYLGSDHAGFELKAHLLKYLTAKGYEVVDVGPYEYDPDDDYPAHCFATGEHTVNDPGGLGVVIGGAGNGEPSAGKKGEGGPAALACDPPAPRAARPHNDPNAV